MSKATAFNSISRAAPAGSTAANTAAAETSRMTRSARQRQERKAPNSATAVNISPAAPNSSILANAAVAATHDAATYPGLIMKRGPIGVLEATQRKKVLSKRSDGD